jgi:hypothetical protein
LKDVQLIIETYYESEEAIQQALSTPEGKEIARLLTSKNKGHLGVFLGKEYTFTAHRDLIE